MELIIQFILDGLIEGAFEIVKNKKVNKIIRILLLVLLIGFFSTVIFGLFALGIIILFKKEYLGATIILGIALFLLTFSIIRFRKVLNRKE